MARGLHKLSALAVTRAKEPGRYADGGGLHLLVKPSGGRYWIMRFMLNGKSREMGLGSVEDVSLAEAREAAAEARKRLQAGHDPIRYRDAEKAAIEAAAAKVVTFKQCAEMFIAAHKPKWKNEKHAEQWTNTLTTYAFPIFGELPVGEVDTGLVLKVLEPIWYTKTETASRLRGRIENVLDHATARGYRSGENPARWRGHLAHLMPARSLVQTVEHHSALPHSEVGGFMARLVALDSVSARALRFSILTATRTEETRGAVWTEIDLEAATWTLPPPRHKTGKRSGLEHRVPLSPPALAILSEMEKFKVSEFVFPGAKPGRPLSNMALLQVCRRLGFVNENGRGVVTHGFRSTFRDWAEEKTTYHKDVAELSLAHTVGNKVEKAYRRSDMFEKRRALMNDWANHCDPKGLGVSPPVDTDA